MSYFADDSIAIFASSAHMRHAASGRDAAGLRALLSFVLAQISGNSRRAGTHRNRRGEYSYYARHIDMLLAH